MKDERFGYPRWQIKSFIKTRYDMITNTNVPTLEAEMRGKRNEKNNFQKYLQELQLLLDDKTTIDQCSDFTQFDDIATSIVFASIKAKIKKLPDAAKSPFPIEYQDNKDFKSIFNYVSLLRPEDCQYYLDWVRSDLESGKITNTSTKKTHIPWLRRSAIARHNGNSIEYPNYQGKENNI